jgi:hypothetical protein
MTSLLLSAYSQLIDKKIEGYGQIMVKGERLGIREDLISKGSLFKLSFGGTEVKQKVS